MSTDVVIADDEARELTPEEQQARAEDAYALEAQIKQNIVDGREAMWELAKNLYEFNEASGWSALGYETQTEWLAQPEIGLTKTDYFRMIRRYQNLVLDHELETPELMQLEPSKIDMVLKTLENNSKPMVEVLDDVKNLSARDIREKYMGAKARAAKGDVIDGTASDVDANGKPSKEAKERAALAQSATAVDSWLSVGGDRKKAQRHWAKLLETHPIFALIATITSVVEGEEDAPGRQDVKAEWKTIVSTLKLKINAE